MKAIKLYSKKDDGFLEIRLLKHEKIIIFLALALSLTTTYRHKVIEYFNLLKEINPYFVWIFSGVIGIFMLVLLAEVIKFMAKAVNYLFFGLKYLLLILSVVTIILHAKKYYETGNLQHYWHEAIVIYEVLNKHFKGQTISYKRDLKPTQSLLQPVQDLQNLGVNYKDAYEGINIQFKQEKAKNDSLTAITETMRQTIAQYRNDLNRLSNKAKTQEAKLKNIYAPDPVEQLDITRQVVIF